MLYLSFSSGYFYSPESDPPHKIMRYWFYYSIWLGLSFRSDRICHVEMIYWRCTSFEKAFRRGQPLNILYDSQGRADTGLTSSLKIDEIDKSISSIQDSKSQKRDFSHFSGAKVCYSNGKVRFENFMHVQWSEENFLKGNVGEKRRLRF